MLYSILIVTPIHCGSVEDLADVLWRSAAGQVDLYLFDMGEYYYISPDLSPFESRPRPPYSPFCMTAPNCSDPLSAGVLDDEVARL